MENSEPRDFYSKEQNRGKPGHPSWRTWASNLRPAAAFCETRCTEKVVCFMTAETIDSKKKDIFGNGKKNIIGRKLTVHV